MLGQKKKKIRMSLHELNKVKGMVSLDEHQASPKAEQLKAKRALPGP